MGSNSGSFGSCKLQGSASAQLVPVSNVLTIMRTRTEPSRNAMICMDDLPQDLLIDILKFLTPRERLQSELVCTRWREASTKHWNEIVLKPINGLQYQSHLRWLGGLQSRALVSSLQFSGGTSEASPYSAYIFHSHQPRIHIHPAEALIYLRRKKR